MGDPADPSPLITVQHRVQLEKLLGSWEVRARANLAGKEAPLLRSNIVALRSALATASLTFQYETAFVAERERAGKVAGIVEEVRARLDEFAAYRGPRPKRADMRALAARLQDAHAVLTK